MENRSPLRDLNNTAVKHDVCDAEKLRLSMVPRIPRKSLLKAFDPLYESPIKYALDISDNENCDPNCKKKMIFSDTLRISPISNTGKFVESIINEILNKIYHKCDTVRKDSHKKSYTTLHIISDENINDSNVININENTLENKFSALNINEDFVESILNEALNKTFQDSDLLRKDSTFEFIVDENIYNSNAVNVKEEALDNSFLALNINELPDEISTNIICKGEMYDADVVTELKKQLIEKDQHLKEIISKFEKERDKWQNEIERKSDELQKNKEEMQKKDFATEQQVAKIKAKFEEEREALQNKLDTTSDELYKIKEIRRQEDSKRDQQLKALHNELELKYSKQQEVMLKQETEKYETLRKELTLKEKEFGDEMERIDQMVKKQVSELENLKSQHSSTSKHLSTLEVAFDDVHQKYQRSKTIIHGYKSNENILLSNIERSKSNFNQYDAKLEAMKQQASKKINVLRIALHNTNQENTAELSKLLVKVKHLEIKNKSLTTALGQKSQECRQLTKLCEEVTRK